MSGTVGYTGFQDLTSTGSDLNAQAFLIAQILSTVRTAAVVRVTAVTNAGGISPVGTVDVLPLVNQTDGAANATAHGVVHGLPYFRLQGGTNAIIIDPGVGDIGLAIFADRDSSAVKATKKQSNPGSWRRHNMADGFYLGGFLNGTPAQYIAYSSGGISIVTPNKLTITSANAILDASGNLAVTGAVVAGVGTGDQVGLQTHRHGTGTNAAGTVAPTAGT